MSWHASASTGKWLLVFGGRTPQRGPMTREHAAMPVVLVDMVTQRWSAPASVGGRLPTSRVGHTAVLWRGWAFVFGGCYEGGPARGTVFYGDLHAVRIG